MDERCLRLLSEENLRLVMMGDKELEKHILKEIRKKKRRKNEDIDVLCSMQ